MSEANFKAMQILHESLLKKQQAVTGDNQQEFIKEVREYIEKAKRAGSNIPSTRERDQIRANLRYWGNYIYSIDKTFPDTELAPSTVKEKRLSTNLIGAIVGIVIILFAAFLIIRPRNNSTSETPTNTPTSAGAVISTETQPVVTQASATPTVTSMPESSEFEVTLLNPSNGDDITPQIDFNGTYNNLKFGWAIHVLFMENGKYFPVKEYYSIPEKPETNEWEIETRLAEGPEELSKPQNYSFVLAISLDDAAREVLLDSSETGIDFNSLPSTVIDFKDTPAVVYRSEGYVAVQETRLVYSYYDGRSYNLYAAKPDGSDPIQITDSPDIYYLSPKLSPDGTEIVYVQNVRSIHIMDSNGQNDREITNGGQNILENPQWSPDSTYISYAFGDTSQSINATYWSIHTYQIVGKDDKNISGEPGPLILNRYHCWIPNSRQIVYNARTRSTGTSGFIETSIDSPEAETLFFDTEEDDVEPGVNIFNNGYLLTYTVIDPITFSHNVYAVIDSDDQFPFDGAPIRLTRTTGAADHPILSPDLKSIYYVREGKIFKVNFTTEGNTIILTPGVNTDDGEYYGDFVMDTGTVSVNMNFDIHYMDTFLPIQ